MGRRLTFKPGEQRNGLTAISCSGPGSSATVLYECDDCKTLGRCSRQTWSYQSPYCRSCSASRKLLMHPLALSGDGLFCLTAPAVGAPDEIEFGVNFVPSKEVFANTPRPIKPLYILKKIGKYYGFVPVEKANKVAFPVPDEGYEAIVPMPLQLALDYITPPVVELPSMEEERTKLMLHYITADDIPNGYRGSAAIWYISGREWTYLYLRGAGVKQKNPPTELPEGWE